jgi:hypothetical protein
MSTEIGLELDVLALVGEMPDQPCESAYHTEPEAKGIWHDDGPATHYLQMVHECSWMAEGEIYAGCALSAANARRVEGRPIHCSSCGNHLLPGEWVRVVGPITKSS